MRQITIVVGVAAAAAIALSGCATEPENAAASVSLPRILAGNTVRVTATVEAVDKQNRVLALRDPGGEVRIMKIDPAIKNFDKIERGDRVNTEYLEEVAVYIEAPGMALKDETASITAKAPGDGKPSGAVVDIVQRRATVQDIDYANRIVTLRAPDGSVRTIRVAPTIGPLDKISKGDPIVVRYTQIVAIGITKATR